MWSEAQALQEAHPQAAGELDEVGVLVPVHVDEQRVDLVESIDAQSSSRVAQTRRGVPVDARALGHGGLETPRHEQEVIAPVAVV